MKQEEEKKPKHSKKISKIQIALLISVAILFDTVVFIFSLFNLIPGIGLAISFYLLFIVNTFANLTFLTWYFLLGVRLFRPSRIVVMWGMYFFSFIPILNLLPFWVVSVILMIIFTRTHIPIRLIKIPAK